MDVITENFDANISELRQPVDVSINKRFVLQIYLSNRLLFLSYMYAMDTFLQYPKSSSYVVDSPLFILP